MDAKSKKYVAVVQCDITKETCTGYLCEKAWKNRDGGFEIYGGDEDIGMLPFSCGGCCGKALHRKLSLLLRKLKSLEGIEKDQVVVQFSSCITTNNYHSPRCPHIDYMKQLVERHGLDIVENTVISKLASKRRGEGVYPGEPG